MVKNTIIGILVAALIVLLVFIFTYRISNIPQNNQNTKENVGDVMLPNIFVNIDSLDYLKIGDVVSDYIVTAISEERTYSDGSKGHSITFELSPNYNGIKSLQGDIFYDEEIGYYTFHLKSNRFNLPIMFIKNERGYHFLDDGRIIHMNEESGSFLYKYWSSNDKEEGEVYLKSFDIEGSRITNLKVNPVSI